MLADTAEQYFALILDPASKIVKTKSDLAAALADFDVSDDIRSTFVDTARIGPEGGVVHFEYGVLRPALGDEAFFAFLQRLGMSRKMFDIFQNKNCSPHPAGEYGRCVGQASTACISGMYGCA